MTDTEARDRLATALGTLAEDDVMYDHPVAPSGEPMDPVLFVRWDAILAAVRAATEPDGPTPIESIAAAMADPLVGQMVMGMLASRGIDLCEPDGLDVAPGRWAFLDTETGDWIEVKPGVVHVAALAAQEEEA